MLKHLKKALTTMWDHSYFDPIRYTILPLTQYIKMCMWVYKVEGKWDKKLYKAVSIYSAGSVGRSSFVTLYNNTKSYYAQPYTTVKWTALVQELTIQTIHTIISLNAIASVQPMSGPVGLAFIVDDAGKVVTKPVEASSRKLRASWCVEVEQDLRTLHGINVMQEVSNVMGREIASELVREVLYHITASAEHHRTLTLSSDVTMNDARIEDSIIRLIQDMPGIRKQANVLVSSDILFALQRGAHSFVSLPVPPGSVSGLQLVGTLAGDVNVFVTSDQLFKGVLVSATNVHLGEHFGKGYVYSPYIPVLSAGHIVSPTDFAPVMCYITRGGSSSSASAPFTNGKMYGTITVNTLLTEDTTNGIQSGNRT